MGLQAISFELPTFTPIPDYDPDGLFEYLEQNYSGMAKYQKSENHLRILRRATKKFPWLSYCLPSGTSGDVNAIVPETVHRPSEVSFRPLVWHIDNSAFGSRLRMFRTSTPALFASGTFQVECAEHMSNRAFSEQVRVFGTDWFEQIVGLTPVVANKGYGRIDSFIKDIVNLQFIPGEPGVLADGQTDKTLHTSAMVKESDPATSVIYRAQYNPYPSVAQL